MKISSYWLVFAGCALGWLILYLLIAPSMNGTDVFIFRDAGWNLASSGSFESAALMYMRDLTPRLYSHYTPMMPLLFAGYASVFPRNAYAGTIFNLLLGLLAAAVALFWVLRQPESRLRNAVALAIAVLPVVFITYDRPEALALVLFCVTIGAATASGSQPAVVGLFIALTFLAHPFVAVTAAIWASALVLSRNWSRSTRWMLTLRQITIMGASAIAPLILVAWLFYSLDHDSLRRFAAHALGFNSGLGVLASSQSHLTFRQALYKASLAEGFLGAERYLLALASFLAIAAWSFSRRKLLHTPERLSIAAALCCVAITVVLFPAQGNYVVFLAFAIPLGLLIAHCNQGYRAGPALALLLLAALIQIPACGLSLLERIEQRASFHAAQNQPAYLLANLPSPDSIVAVEGGNYDFFKPRLHHLIELDNAQGVKDYGGLAAVVNCYEAFHGADQAVRPLPPSLNASEFQLIQAAPQHMWVTLLRHRAMRGQWGYGCDLYVRKNGADIAVKPRS